MSPWIVDTDAWWIVTSIDNGLISYTRRAAEVVRENEFTTQNLQFATTKRWSSGWTDWKGVYGTAGA